MGGNIVRRLLRDGHTAVVFDQNPEAVAALVAEGATGAASLEEFVSKLDVPRAAWVMLPAGAITEATVAQLGDLMQPDDVIIDGGNSFYKDDNPAGSHPEAEGHPLRRCRHVGRRLGPGTRLLHDDRGEQRRPRQARPESSRPWHRASAPSRRRRVARAATPAPRKGYIHAGAERRRAFRQDGP